MSKVLKMTFQVNDSKNVTYNLDNPKEDLTKAQVEGAMQSIIDKKMIVSDGENAKAIKDIVVRETNDVALA